MKKYGIEGQSGALTARWVSRRRLGAAVLLLSGLVLAGCQSHDEASGGDSPDAGANVTYRKQSNPMAGRAPAGGAASGAATGGAAIFQQNCGRCHRAGSVGNGRNDLSHVGAEKDQKWIEVQIRDPSQHQSKMPAFPAGRLPDADLHTVASFLAAMK